MALISGLSDVGMRARRRIAWRLLPFVFILYVVAYIDRVNVSFTGLRMNSDLGFSDRVFGLGVGIFYISYVLFEIPGAIIVERWSARKWIARIMISWGIVTILIGFVHSVVQFYAVRFFLGVAEASFLPGMIVYLTRWFRLRERSRAIACLFAAIPTASLVGSPLAGWLLGVHWRGLAGWRWLFILEGTPAIILGIITFFYLTDWPSQAPWLPQDERDWLINELQAELQAKKKIRNYTIIEAFCDRQVLLLLGAYFLAMSGALGSIYWIPTFVKRLSGFSDRAVTSLLLVPALIGIAGALINAWHCDKTAERRWHTAIPLVIAGLMYGLSIPNRHDLPLAISFLLLGSGFLYAFYPVFWSMPTMMLSESAAAATFGLITSIGQLGGLAGPYVIGFLNYRTHSLTASFGFIALVYVAAGSLILSLRIHNPHRASQGSNQLEK
ncbi:MAG TPA: MFS transporter [Candidatus Acidoferrum sp.]|nr:MFS transporter [Candidatus Acidoferrum sp.]